MAKSLSEKSYHAYCAKMKTLRGLLSSQNYQNQPFFQILTKQHDPEADYLGTVFSQNSYVAHLAALS